MKPLHWLSVKWALFFAAMFVHEKKILLQYIICADKLSICLVAWSSNNQDLWLCMWFLSLAFPWHVKSWTLPLYGFWLLLAHKCEYHHTDQKEGVSSSTRWLCLFAPFVTSDYANHFLVAPVSLHYWVDVTSSQSKAQCLLTSFVQKTQVMFCC
jgi:hypothetical protein